MLIESSELFIQCDSLGLARDAPGGAKHFKVKHGIIRAEKQNTH